MLQKDGGERGEWGCLVHFVVTERERGEREGERERGDDDDDASYEREV